MAWLPPLGSGVAGQRLALLVADISTPTLDAQSLLQSATVDADGFVEAEIDTQTAQTTMGNSVLWRVTSGLRDLAGSPVSLRGCGLYRLGLEVDEAAASGNNRAHAFVAGISDATFPSAGAGHGVGMESNGTGWQLCWGNEGNLRAFTQGAEATARLAFTQFPITYNTVEAHFRGRTVAQYTAAGAFLTATGNVATQTGYLAGVLVGVTCGTGSGSATTATIRFRPYLQYLGVDTLLGAV